MKIITAKTRELRNKWVIQGAKLFNNTFNLSSTRTYIDTIRDSPLTTIAIEGTQLLGMITSEEIQLKHENVFMLADMAVTPELRHKGLGKDLIKTIIKASNNYYRKQKIKIDYYAAMTQNPVIYKLMNEEYNAWPKPEIKTDKWYNKLTKEILIELYTELDDWILDEQNMIIKKLYNQRIVPLNILKKNKENLQPYINDMKQRKLNFYQGDAQIMIARNNKTLGNYL